MNDREIVRKMSLEVDALLKEKEDLSNRLEKAQEEIARLKTVPMKYRRMEFNAQLQKENKNLHEKIAQLEEDNQLLRRKIENHIIMSEDFKAEYNSWLRDLEEKDVDNLLTR